MDDNTLRQTLRAIGREAVPEDWNRWVRRFRRAGVVPGFTRRRRRRPGLALGRRRKRREQCKRTGPAEGSASRVAEDTHFQDLLHKDRARPMLGRARRSR